MAARDMDRWFWSRFAWSMFRRARPMELLKWTDSEYAIWRDVVPDRILIHRLGRAIFEAQWEIPIKEWAARQCAAMR